MPSITFTQSISGMAEALSYTATRTEDAGEVVSITTAVGQAGVLTTRTGDDSGTITMDDGGHTITTAQIVDIYWVESGVEGLRRVQTVGTVSGTSVPISVSGEGDVLPSATTAVTVATRVPFTANIDGDELGLISIQHKFTDANDVSKSYVDLLDAGAATIYESKLHGFILRVWDITGGDTNDFTGNAITNGIVSNGSSANGGTLKMAWVEDATP